MPNLLYDYDKQLMHNANETKNIFLIESYKMEDFYKQHGLDKDTVVKEQLKQKKSQEIMDRFEAGILTYMKHGYPETVTNKKQAYAMAFQYSEKHWYHGFRPKNQPSIAGFFTKKIS